MSAESWFVTVEGQTGWLPGDRHRADFEWEINGTEGARFRRQPEFTWDAKGRLEVRIAVGPFSGEDEARASALRIIGKQRNYVMSEDQGVKAWEATVVRAERLSSS